MKHSLYPPLFLKLRGAIDNQRKRNGRFLLLGSITPSLMQHVSESLAGRLSLLKLHPFNILELGVDQMDGLWLYGGYPNGGVLGTDTFPGWQRNYVEFIVLRDLPKYGLEVNAITTMKLLKMLGHMHGKIWNASEVGRSLGASYHTVNRYTDLLEGVFLIRRLQPYFKNVGKRLIKSPKVYWVDSGLCHALMGVQTFDDLLTQPFVGASWEGFVIEQIISTLEQKGIHFEPYYFRSNDGMEIDLLIESGPKLIAIEIKLSSEPQLEDVKKLSRYAKIIEATHEILICRTTKVVEEKNKCYCNVIHALSYLEEALNSKSKTL